MNEQGICPVCDSAALEYEPAEIIDNGVIYPWTCSECHATGKEAYDLVFDRHYDVTEYDGD